MRRGGLRDGGRRIAWSATLARKGAAPLHKSHLKFLEDEATAGILHCFLLDCSASMLKGGRLADAKGLLLGYFDALARERAQAALIRFGGARADVLFGPTVPRWWNERWIHPIGGGGGTPLTSGVAAAARLLERSGRRRPGQVRVLWVLTDGRTREQPARPPAADRVVVVDCGRDWSVPDRCQQLADALRAEYSRLDKLAVRG